MGFKGENEYFTYSSHKVQDGIGLLGKVRRYTEAHFKLSTYGIDTYQIVAFLVPITL
jgi:hypothetical protein